MEVLTPDYYDFPIGRPPLGEFEHGGRFMIDGNLIGKYQPAARWQLMEHIHATLSDPCAVLRDLKRTGFEEAVAYSRSVAETRHVCMVYAAYNEELDAMIVFDFEPRFEDSWRKGLPENFKNDFGDPLWTKHKP